MQVIDFDFSRLEGSNCYCSQDCADTIRTAAAESELHAIHLIGTGDYHYISLFWAERIDIPFSLVLFDNHPDDQNSAFGGELLSCGSWVSEVRKLPMCVETVWNGTETASRDIYLSIDLDILSTDWARTDWSQGEMNLPELLEKISKVLEGRRLIGVDICGGLSESKGGTVEDLELNQRTTEAILNLIQFASA